MIVWLASYPRSGNTLLRQVLKQCFGLDSYEGPGQQDHVDEGPDRQGWQEARVAYGNLFATECRDSFLAAARACPERALIKTHEVPCDDEATIYVVRDGRLTLQSYTKYQQTYHGAADSFTSLLVGNHFCRDWTTHYRLWCENRRAPVLVLHFEELVNAGPQLLARLAEFLGHTRPVLPWVNPQARLQELVPAFFGKGQARWTPDAFWTEARLRQFTTLHGPLSCELGYLDEVDCRRLAHPADSDEGRMLHEAYALARKRWELQQVCDERAVVIEQLRQACDERAVVIENLRQACDAARS